MEQLVEQISSTPLPQYQNQAVALGPVVYENTNPAANLSYGAAPTVTETFEVSQGNDSKVPHLKWSWVSLLIGILIGMAIMLFIVWILFMLQVSVFNGTVNQTPACATSDYYQQPGTAILNGFTVSDILSLNSSGQLLYQRVPSNTMCRPGVNQSVVIQQPQYCSFTLEDGTKVEGKNFTFGGNRYEATLANGQAVQITTSINCQPTNSVGANVVSGVPELKWDAAPQTC